MTVSPQRAEVLRSVAARVPAGGDAPVRVAIDGVDGSGKTTFADELAAVLAARPVIRASVDSFHRPSAERYRRGQDSPTGFWLDAFDYDRLRSDLLEPLGAGGNGRYRRAVHDLATDEQLDGNWQQAEPGAVLVVDGLFLHRDELAGYWDLSVFLDVPFTETAARMATRDGTPPDPDHPRLQRYVRAQRLYFTACRPRERATLVIDNTDWKHPVIAN